MNKQKYDDTPLYVRNREQKPDPNAIQAPNSTVVQRIIPWYSEVKAKSEKFARAENPSPLLVEWMNKNPEYDYRQKK